MDNKKDNMVDPEQRRLIEDKEDKVSWKRWGPYLSERQWGTVREDYSEHGEAWDYFSHDHARSRAYRWGEDGLAGFSDDQQNICLSLGLWNGVDPILKERIFGLTNSEGNHGEDVKEIYYYLDATPTHSYLKMLYKYPQTSFPYGWLAGENRNRGQHDMEFELIDTGVFDNNRYFDVFVEYAQAGAGDILMQITAHNRGPDAADLHILPHLCFRNKWSWSNGAKKPECKLADKNTVSLKHEDMGDYYYYVDGDVNFLFTENETNNAGLYGYGDKGYSKDAFHNYVIQGQVDAINPAQSGTKVAGWSKSTVDGGSSVTLRVRLSPKPQNRAFSSFDKVMNSRRKEADLYYATVQAGMEDDAKLVQRQAFAGMIWSKQFFYLDIPQWIKGDKTQPPPPSSRKYGRNSEWLHLNNADIISMPDKWEYPWYAAWDLAFHCIPLAIVDANFAKQQLMLLTREWYMHPNGQIPAYEWAFGDVNPPVHAWATWRVYQIDRKQNNGKGDLQFLERVFHKLMLNFTWWVNRKDAEGHNIFQGGFLGLDNIGVFDRSAPLPTGGFINQADGTSWVAMFSLNLMRISLELALHNPVYEDIATKYFEHFLHIAEAMTNMDGQGVSLWDEEDAFYYDQLKLPNGEVIPLKVRSMVGLIPLYAVEVIDAETLEKLPNFNKRLMWYLKYKPELHSLVACWQTPGQKERRLLCLLPEQKLRSVLTRMLDETEFLSKFGLRALSAQHREPFIFDCLGVRMGLNYEPAESTTGLFGGNSNWRGPIWFPVNYLLIESLQKFHHYYGGEFKVECPTGSGIYLNLGEVATELGKRLSRIFLADNENKRPVFGHSPRMQEDPYFKDHLLFYEYFHGDNGRGVGANHQTGWTGLVAKLLQPQAPTK